jgi:hypothetical protein
LIPVGGLAGLAVVAGALVSSSKLPSSKLQQQHERISALPKAQQRFVMQMPDTALQLGE